MGQQRRRKSWLRERVVAELHRNGPIEDQKGRALQVLAERVGHHSSMSVGNVIRQLESEGNAERVTAKDGHAPRDPDGNPSPHVRRTYRVALTDEFIATLPPLATQPEPSATDVGAPTSEPEAAHVAEGGDGHDLIDMPANLDYDAFANAVMGIVFNNLNAPAKMVELRRELADTEAALSEAKQVIDALGAELKAERKERGKIEDEAAALSAKVEELEFKLKNGGRNNGWEKVPVDAFKQLDRIMREVPTVRG